jgi:hypothetical protein
VIGIFPSRQSLLRLTGALLEEQNDEWAVGRRCFGHRIDEQALRALTEEVVQALLKLQSA